MADKTIAGIKAENIKKSSDIARDTDLPETVLVEDRDGTIMLSEQPSCGQSVDGDRESLSGNRLRSGQSSSGSTVRSGPQSDMIGRILDNKFKIIRKLGDGGMGVVYEAEHMELKSRYAIKSIRTEYTTNEEFNLRFDREAKTQAQMQHPNIIQVTNYFREGGRLYLVMHYIKGKGLDQLLKGKKFSEDQVLAIIKDVLKALDHAHSRGIIHRDIKPSNIMMAEDNTAMLMDFGIATLVEEDTKHKHVMAGTPSYMSPEQINNPGTMDHRADIYSIGIVLYEMLAGKRPFDGKTASETQMNHLEKEIPDVKSILTDSFAGLSDIIEKALEKQPENRFENSRAFIDAIDQYYKRTHIECRHCRTVNRVQNKYKLKGEKCLKCGKILSMRSKFTKIWAAAFLACLTAILAYMVYPWPGKLFVKTTPENAVVFIGGKMQGRSPLNIPLDPGEYDVFITKGGKYENVRRTISIKKRDTTELLIKLPLKDAMHRKAFDTFQQAYLSALNISRNLKELDASRINVKIAEKIGDSSITEGYRKQIADLQENIGDFQQNYLDAFSELKVIKPEIQKSAYDKYAGVLEKKQGNIQNLSMVWKHFQLYLSDGLTVEELQKELRAFR